MPRLTFIAITLLGWLSLPPHFASAQMRSATNEPLPATQPLTWDGDLAMRLVDGVDVFLRKQIEETAVRRHDAWKSLVADPERLEKELPELRQRLAKILGAHEERIKISDPVQVSRHELVKTERFVVQLVSWPVLRDIRGEGLLLLPNQPIADVTVITIPDADQTPEQLIGLAAGVSAERQFPRRLAEAGVPVLVPFLIDRHMEKRNGRSVLSDREYLYRPAFELGRHLIGYEVQKIIAAAEWLTGPAAPFSAPREKVSAIGYGEGGMLALYAGAIHSKWERIGVSGYFGRHAERWDEPLDRNVFGLLNHFGNAELAALAVLSRPAGSEPTVVIEAAGGPSVELTGNAGGAPIVIRPIAVEDSQAEFEILAGYLPQKNAARWIKSSADAFGTTALLRGIVPTANLDVDAAPAAPEYAAFSAAAHAERITARAHRQRDQIEQDTQRLLIESPYVRAEYMKKLDTTSVEKFEQSAAAYRETFAKDVIGRFDLPLASPQPRSRKAYDEPKWTGYEVALDVFPDVIAYGILLVPKDIPAGERRPVVVCQHGLEGRPQDVIGDEKRPIYEAFAAKLAERGFVTFAPQNLYIGRDRFRTLQRKANPLGKTLFSVIIPQHQQIVNWLGTLPFVDKDRMAFYGLSYGGKSAMRIPPLVKEYKAVICSADFNEWVWKNASTRAPYSYVWTNEYEIFEWDLGSTFNYAEMAALICPRPFMVERGHFDGVSSDEAVAYEFAKVLFLYQAKLKLKDRCEMEVFDGPHKINGVGTFDFLHKHLNHPKR